MNGKQQQQTFWATEPSRKSSRSAFSSLAPAKPSEVYDTYWRFAAERQAVFFRRYVGEPPPWSDDEILQTYKFTNAYRASDRVSQYLIRNVIYRGPEATHEVFFRVILFKLFNKIETWELLRRELGDVTYDGFSFERYDRVLTNAMDRKQTIYSAAYIMPSGSTKNGSTKKHRSHLQLLQRMMDERVPDRIATAGSMREAFNVLVSYPMIGDFLGYQYVTDLNYSEMCNFTEMEFVVPGPGAVDGISKCFSSLGGLTGTDIIKLVTERQAEEFERLGLEFQSLFGRPLQLIDCQNLFCEIGKYARVRHPDVNGIANRTRIKQKYKPNFEPIALSYPPKWGINDRIERTHTEKELPRLNMDFRTYQTEAARTDQVAGDDEKGKLVPLPGLAGEVGTLLSEYKKFLRDGSAHQRFDEQVAEDLGDLLWYVANVASKFGLDLDDVAQANLEKTRGRWPQRASQNQPTLFDTDRSHLLDEDFQPEQQIPRKVTVQFEEVQEGDSVRVIIRRDGQQIGDTLTDNAYEDDGYRFHDVFHLSYAAVLGWSPITRKLLKVKRKADEQIDEVGDGARARIIEELISQLVYTCAREHNYLDGVGSLDYHLLKTIHSLVADHEVKVRSLAEWERAIFAGYDVWRQVREHRGGTVEVNLLERRISFLGPSSDRSLALQS